MNRLVCLLVLLVSMNLRAEAEIDLSMMPVCADSQSQVTSDFVGKFDQKNHSRFELDASGLKTISKGLLGDDFETDYKSRPKNFCKSTKLVADDKNNPILTINLIKLNNQGEPFRNQPFSIILKKVGNEFGIQIPSADSDGGSSFGSSGLKFSGGRSKFQQVSKISKLSEANSTRSSVSH